MGEVSLMPASSPAVGASLAARSHSRSHETIPVMRKPRQSLSAKYEKVMRDSWQACSLVIRFTNKNEQPSKRAWIARMTPHDVIGNGEDKNNGDQPPHLENAPPERA